MAQNNVSITVKATDQASGTLNKIAGNINQFANNSKKSTSGLTNLGKSLGNLKNSIPGIGLVAASIAGITAAVGKGINKLLEFEDAWSKVEQSSMKLDIAGKLNKNLQGTSSELKAFASNLSSELKNTFSGGEIMEAMSSISFDKSADQIKAITAAGTDLAKAMGTDLNSAISQLNNTYSGNIGQLGKIFPALKTFTKEELEAGKAVEYVQGKLQGVAKELADSTTGSITAYKNAMGDLKEEMGALVTNFFTPLRNWLTSIAKGWADALQSQREYKEYSKKYEAGTTNASDLEGYIRTAKTQYSNLEAKRTADQNDYTSSGTYYDDYTKQMDELAAKIKDAETKLIWARNSSFQEEQRNKQANYQKEMQLVQQRYKLEQEKLAQEQAALDAQKEAEKEAQRKANDAAAVARLNGIKSKSDTKQSQFDKWYSDMVKTEDDISDVLSEMLKLTDSDYRYSVDTVGKTWSKWAKDIAAEYKEFAEEELKERLRIDREKYQKELEQEKQLLAEKEQKEREEKVNAYTSSLGDVGSIISAAVSGNWASFASSEVSQLISKIAENSEIVSTVLNFISEIMDAVVPPLVTILENVLTPILPIIQTVGDTLAIMLELLAPISEWVLGPIMKTISTVIVSLLGSIYNTVVAVHNALVWRNKWEYMDVNKSIADIWQNNITSSGVSGTSSTAVANASYTAARDIYININYNNSFVNGDAMAIAINLRDKIREAEKMGY